MSGFFQGIASFFKRLFSGLKFWQSQEDWLESYNHEAADVDDDLMDLNNVSS